MGPPPGPRREAWTLATILAIAAALRFAGLGAHSFWFDEVQAMRLARFPSVVEMLSRFDEFDHSDAPLHPILLRAWISAVGSTDGAARALSALASVAGVAAVYLVGRLAFGPPVAACAALLQAISPADIHYAREVRMYSMLVLAACLAWAALFAMRKSATWWKVAWLVAAETALLYLHPLGAFMVIALAVGYAIDLPITRLRPRRWMISQAAVAIAISPWISRYLDHPPDSRTPPLSLGRYLDWPRYFTGGGTPAVVVAGLVIAWVIVAGLWRKEVHASRTAALLASWLIIPAALLIGYSAVRHPLFGPSRYLLFAGPAFLLMLAAGIQRLRPACRRVAVPAFSAIALASLPNAVYDGRLKPEWRQAADIVSRVDPSAPVFVLAREPHIYFPTLRYYLTAAGQVRPADSLADGGSPDTVWCVGDSIDGLRVVPDVLSSKYVEERAWRFDRLTLRHFTRPTPPALVGPGDAAPPGVATRPAADRPRARLDHQEVLR